MSLRTQAKILRILQEQEIRAGRRGPRPSRSTSGSSPPPTATWRPRSPPAPSGEDLFYRLNVVPLEVPPLRQRLEDLPLLARRFLEDYCPKADLEPKKLTAEALAAMQAYHWPGNVRELKNMIERLVILTPGPLIEVSNLPHQFHRQEARPGYKEGLAQATLREARAAFEKALIIDRLEKLDWNVSATAESLSVERSHLHKKMKALGIGNG